MALSWEDVRKIASLARLELDGEEMALYQEQLSAVLAYAERLNELDLDGVLPTSSAISQNNILREDKIEPSLSMEDVLFNAPHHSENQFVIQAVLDEV